MLTANGYIKKVSLNYFSSIRSTGILAIRLVPDDELKWVRCCTNDALIAMASQNGMIILSFGDTIKCPDNTSNFVEGFNATLTVHRTKPIYSLLEGIRGQIMVRHCERQEASENWNVNGVCPGIVKKLTTLEKHSKTRCCVARPSGRQRYEVLDGSAQLVVDLEKAECTCGRWQHTGIPCRHAIKAIMLFGGQPIQHVSHYYSVRCYKASYEFNIQPVPSTEFWTTQSEDCPTIQHPILKRGIGRPARNRRREENEKPKGKRANNKCTKCNSFGHNKRTCKGGPTAREKRAAAAAVGQSSQDPGPSTSSAAAPTNPRKTRRTRREQGGSTSGVGS